jgi:phospholipid/cholesterol/gamma-HCH transport system substrate-binding protein
MTSRRWLIAAVIAGAVLLAVVALAVRRNAWRFERGREYRATFGSVGGLRRGNDVRYGGLDAGSVTAIVIDTANPARFIVTFRVRDQIPIRADTRATIPGVTPPTVHYLDLRPGTQGGRPLPPGSLVPSEESPDVPDVLTRLTAVLERADTMLQAARPLTQHDFFARLDRTVTHLDTLVTLASHNSARLLPQLEATARRANVVLARTDRVLAALDSSHADLAAAPREAVATLRDMHALLDQIRDGMGQEGRMATLMRNLASAGDNLARLSERLERNPASVLQSRRRPVKLVGPKP